MHRFSERQIPNLRSEPAAIPISSILTLDKRLWDDGWLFAAGHQFALTLSG
jgi:hypothetical protein